MPIGFPKIVSKMPRPTLAGMGTAVGEAHEQADVNGSIIDNYSKGENAVQKAELVSGLGSNVGEVAGAVSRFVSAGSKAAPALNFAKAAGSKFAPVQAALWGVDAGRAVFDPAYREQNLNSFNQRLGDPNTSTLMASLETGSNVLSRPVGTLGAMARSYGDASDTINKNAERDVLTDKKIGSYQRGLESKKRIPIMEGQLSKAQDDHYRKTPEMESLGDQKSYVPFNQR